VRKKDWLTYLPLAIVFILAVFIRFYRLDLNTPEIYGDEAGQYFLRNQFFSQTSNILSFLYNKFFIGTFTFTWFLGLTPLGVRSPSALYGSLACLSGFYFAHAISKNKIISLVTALLIAFLPWSFMISRIGHTHVPILVLLTCVHIALFMKAKSIKNYLLSFLFLAISLLYYPQALFVGPFVFILFIGWEIVPKWKEKKIFFIWFSLALSLVAIAAMWKFQIFSNTGRGFDLAIWRDINTPWEIDKFRGLTWSSSPSIFSFGLPPEKLANKIVYNRFVANLSVFSNNYLSFFSPNWLFLRGDTILRHSTGQVGSFYPFLIPFMLYGAFKFFKDADKKARFTFLVWIIVSPIPAAVTKDGAGYLLRVVTLLPFLTYFCALGIVESFTRIKKSWRWPYGVVLTLIGLYSTFYFFYGYFHVYPALSARAYLYGFHDLSDFQLKNNNASMLVVWDGFHSNNQFRFWQRTSSDQFNAWSMKVVVIGQTHFYQTFPNLFFVEPKLTVDIRSFVTQYKPSYLVLPDQYFTKYSADIMTLTKSKVEEIINLDKTIAFTIYKL